MDNKKLKFVKGKCCAGCPADIYFYTDVDYWSVDDFIWEFNYLLNYVEPSRINIHINSVGGSVVEGMSVFSRIIDCPIPTACYNDGLAASMGSIIWAAGKEVYMKDYALLMIHNPFIDANSGKEYNQVTEAFKQQLQIIYQKRFNLSEEEVNAIMNGEEGNDGTWLTSAQATEKGFIAADHIIETPEAEHGQVDAIIKDGFDVSKLKAVMNSLTDISALASVTTKKDETSNSNNNNTMEKNEITVFAALLGLTGEKANAENVSAQINELKVKAEKYDGLKAALEETKKNLGSAQVELEASKASVKNLTEDLTKAKDELKVYQDAEKAAQENKVNALIDGAIADCKLDKSERDKWIELAKSSYELVEHAIAQIPARDNLGNIIAQKNNQQAQKGTKSAEDEAKARVDAVVGTDFKFRTLE